ncbi:MAG: ABC transporter ATP-binding protein [Planctomycetota bacterium]
MTEKKKHRSHHLSLGVVWREAKDLMWANRAKLSLGLALMTVSRLAGLALPAAPKFLIDDVIGKGKHDLLWIIALVVGVGMLVHALCSFALANLLGATAQAAITKMRRSVQAHIIRLPVDFFDSTQTGQLISRIMTDAEGIRNLVGTGIVQLTGGMFTAALALAVLFYLNWSLTLLILAILLVFGGGMAMAFKRLRPLFRERGKINAEVTGRLSESLSGVRTVKAYTAERRERFVFARGVHRLLRNVVKAVVGVSAVHNFGMAIIGVISVIMILMGGQAVIDGNMTLGNFVTYIFFTGLLTAPVVQIASIGTQISEAFAGLDRIREIRTLAAEESDEEQKAPLEAIRGDVSFEDVSFEYEPDKPVLRNISFEAAAGSTTALVGPSGSGKTTLVGLVMAFHRPGSGKVALDGRDLQNIRLHDFRKNLGVVLQENFLFDGTIFENIAFSRPYATRDEMEEASRLAHAHDFIMRFDKGYETVVGERGVKLSGGERQRVAIARALLAKPKILILDEATSSLDSENEHLIQKGLAKLREGRTTFVIAHRLSTIRSADQILVLKEGRIVERGTHQKLLDARGLYRDLYDRQYEREQNVFVNPGEELVPRD